MTTTSIAITNPVVTDDRLAQVMTNTRARNTILAYDSAVRAFEAWLKATGSKVNDESACRYLVSMADAGRKTNTIAVHRAALLFCYGNILSQRPLSSVLEGIRRERKDDGISGSALNNPVAKKPLTPIEVGAIVSSQRTAWNGDKERIRNRAMLIIGAWGGFRCSEIAGIKLADVMREPEGLLITLRSSKTNQRGEPETKPIINPFPQSANDPVIAFDQWMAIHPFPSKNDSPLFVGFGITGNPVNTHITTRAIRDILRREMEGAGVDPSGFSAHSLRIGLVTYLRGIGVSDKDICFITRQTERTVARYDQSSIRDAMERVTGIVKAKGI